MAIAFTYTEATNIAVVTGGTSGTPAVFADFVTADRAGTATLLVATAGLSPTLALTYQIRPVEDMALLITFTVAAKTTEADYIFITGTDWRDAAQTESIDVSAGNGAYVSTKYFRTITNIDCSDNAAGGGTQWADGTVAVTQPQWGVIWDYGNGQYKVDAIFNIGNGTTSTYFVETNGSCMFNRTTFCYFVVKAAAIARFGAAYGSYSGAPYHIEIAINSTTVITDGGTLYLYNAQFCVYNSNSITELGTGSFYAYDSSISQTYNVHWGAFNITDGMTQVTLRNVYFYGFHSLVTRTVNMTVDDIYNIDTTSGLQGWNDNVSWGDVTQEGFTDSIDTRVNIATLILIDSGLITLPQIVNADGRIKQAFTCNVTVCDKDGTLLDGVEVLCKDQTDTQAFTTTTGDTDTGKIDEQTIIYKQWAGTSETLTTYSPHKFTLSKAGYETLVLENITVDGPIDWHLELQPAHGAWPKTWR